MLTVAYLNRQKDRTGRLAIFSRLREEGGYREGDELEAVYSEYYPGEYEEICERVFSDLNRGSPTFVGDERYPQRSLSVGDVIEFPESRLRFIVKSSGFEVEDFAARGRRLLVARPMTDEDCEYLRRHGVSDERIAAMKETRREFHGEEGGGSDD